MGHSGLNDPSAQMQANQWLERSRDHPSVPKTQKACGSFFPSNPTKFSWKGISGKGLARGLLPECPDDDLWDLAKVDGDERAGTPSLAPYRDLRHAGLWAPSRQ